MKITRRKFLSAIPVVAGTVLRLNVRASDLDDGLPPLPNDVLVNLGWDSFYPFITTDFTFGTGRSAVSLKLISMENTAPANLRPKAGQECFTLKFQGPFNRPLTQNTYRVNHFNLGDFGLFITNGGRRRREQYYIAVINRITG